MPRERQHTDEEILSAVSKTTNITSLLRELGLSSSGAAHRYLRTKLDDLGVDVDSWRKQNSRRVTPYTSEEIFVKDSPIKSSYKVKQKIFKLGLLEKECSRCGLTEWMGSDSILQLDHVNGVSDDNRIENLRILCANCHMLTDTWGAKKRT